MLSGILLKNKILNQIQLRFNAAIFSNHYEFEYLLPTFFILSWLLSVHRIEPCTLTYCFQLVYLDITFFYPQVIILRINSPIG